MCIYLYYTLCMCIYIYYTLYMCIYLYHTLYMCIYLYSSICVYIYNPETWGQVYEVVWFSPEMEYLQNINTKRKHALYVYISIFTLYMCIYLYL